MVPELYGGASAGVVDHYGLRVLVRQVAGRLTVAGVTSPQVDVHILVKHLLGRVLLLADSADGNFPAAYDTPVLRHGCHEPLQHIIGHMWLRGVELTSRPDVLIVRPETEVMVGAAIEAAREAMNGGGGVILIADLRTGPGTIAAYIAKEVPSAWMVAVGISEATMSLAHRNYERLVSGRVEMIHTDVTDPLILYDLNGQIDVVVSNPSHAPADAVRNTEAGQHGPTVVLYGGDPDGPEIPIDALMCSVVLLCTGGMPVMEHDHGQGVLLRVVALGAGFKQAETDQDLTGRDRYLYAARQVLRQARQRWPGRLPS